MRELLQDPNDLNLTKSDEYRFVNRVKEKFGFVAQNYFEERDEYLKDTYRDKSYTLPDKRQITVPGHVRIQCPELLFNPTLYNMG
jgi:hypothetical protein